MLEGLFERFNLPFEVRRTTEPFLDRGTSADILVDGSNIGWIGEIQRKVLDAYDIKENVFCAELDFDVVSEKGTEERTYRPIPVIPQWFAISPSMWTTLF